MKQAFLIDDEVRKLLDSQYDRAKNLLRERKDELEILARTLLEKEVLLKSDVEKLIGPRPVDVKSQIDQNGIAKTEEEEQPKTENEV